MEPIFADRISDVLWTNTLRLNFSCVDEATIEEGMARLGRIMDRMF